MTRATLLHVLDRPTALGPAEVRELEQLAQAFPYCQTAHLLLAKAAHDQGTMLAGQRLRRAATYAADRTLLRRLIEQVAPAEEPAAAPVVEAPVIPVITVASAEILAPPLAMPATMPETVPAIPEIAQAAPALIIAAAPVVAPAMSETRPEITSEPEIVSSEPTVEPTGISVPTEIVAASELPAEPVTITEQAPATTAPVSTFVAEEAPALDAVPADEIPQLQVTGPQGPDTTMAVLPMLVDQEGTDIPVIEALQEIPEALTKAQLEAEPEEDPEMPAIEEELPAQAPAIRPPVEVGAARFEFGLAEMPPPTVPAYELPGLIDEWAAAAVTLSLGTPDALADALVPAPPPPVFTPAAFTGDATVGYAFGESSRLGFCLQLLDLLTAKAETAESMTAVVAAAQPVAGPLPPAGTLFEPDPLLLDHWATHCPPPPALPSSLDLINNFLRRQPRLTRPAMLPPAAIHQADLSVRSTRVEPELVSENLARIFVRQGKNARAIEIYEKLIVKQPEKAAYFAAQIQQLQPSA